MEKVITKDNAVTFYSEQFKEWYHSKSGAVEEAREKYAVPCKIKDKALQKKLVLLDVCFGLGYNTAAGLEVARKIHLKGEKIIYALENDLEILKKIEEVEIVIEEYSSLKKMIKEVIKKIEEGREDDKENKKDEEKNNKKQQINETSKNPLIKSSNPQTITIQKDEVTLHFLYGDARETIKKVPKEIVDAVFLDPFSPKACPELWTKEFFENIHQTMKKDSILATYSCARVVRDNLKAAHFRVENGPCIGRRAPSTIGYKE